MTPKISRFLAEQRPATPCLIVDLDVIEQQYSTMRKAFQHAHIHYAVKANPAPSILKRLHHLGASFDVASIGEIKQCLAAGIDVEKLSYGHTAKSCSAIAEAHRLGVTLFALDSEEELEKLARFAPGARVFCRLAVLNTGADWPLSGKFGTTPEHALFLLKKASQQGLTAAGLSFHVGSQQTTVQTYIEAIQETATLYHNLKKEGVTLSLVNIGGGFPSHYTETIPEIQDFGQKIQNALRTCFPSSQPTIMLEPGRYLVGDAGIVHSEVILASRRGGTSEDPRWVYLDIGRFGGLAETEGEAIRYRFCTTYDHTSTSQSPCILAGPTCDGVDVLYEKNPVLLPDELQSGDHISILTTGAYVSTYCSTGFNGFEPLTEYYI